VAHILLPHRLQIILKIMLSADVATQTENMCRHDAGIELNEIAGPVPQIPTVAEQVMNLVMAVKW
jgi:hypothetical protein